MPIIHSSKLGFLFHLLVLTIIFVLTLTNTFIAVKAVGRSGADTVIVLGSYSLIILFAYAMYIGTTYSLINEKKYDYGIPEAHKQFFNLKECSLKGYSPVHSTYNEETRETE